MKKVFFMLAFMLIGSFALANNEIKPAELVTKNVKIEKVGDLTLSSYEVAIGDDKRCRIYWSLFDADNNLVGSGSYIGECGNDYVVFEVIKIQ